MADSRRNGSRGRAGGAGGNGRSRTAASKSKGGGSGKGRRAKAARAAGLLRRALTWAAVAGVWCVIAFGGVLAWYAYDLPELGEIEKMTRRSEEHTSELQSLMRNSYAVFCLKNKKTMTTTD